MVSLRVRGKVRSVVKESRVFELLNWKKSQNQYAKFDFWSLCAGSIHHELVEVKGGPLATFMHNLFDVWIEHFSCITSTLRKQKQH